MRVGHDRFRDARPGNNGGKATGGDARFQQQLDEGKARKRRTARGFKYDAVASDQCRAQLMCHEIERIIEGGDGRDNSHWFAVVPANFVGSGHAVFKGESLSDEFA